MENFLTKHGYRVIKSLPQDASARSYHRIAKNDQTAMLMVAPPDETRVGYRIIDFITIANWLNDIGLNAPNIYEVDEQNGFVMLEDFGSIDFKTAVQQGESKEKLYGLAHDVLTYLSDKAPPFELPTYHDSVIHHGHRQIIDYYVPATLARKNEDGLTEEYWQIWEGIEKTLPPCPTSFMHIDYHVENLMWIPDETGLKQCGLLDFQAAMIGPQPYDLANLLEDARMNVPDNIQNDILGPYDDAFKLWYRILGTQFHCRVLGLFIKLPLHGKTKYLEHIPRLQNYLYKGLQHPVLKPINEFFSDLGLDFNQKNTITIEQAKSYIRDDAF